METLRKNSKKRQAMLDILRCTTEHPTAESVYIRMKADYPQLSLATVYRNLNLLVDEEIIRTVGEVNGQVRYDARMDEHAHFVCKSCNSVFDVEIRDNVVYNCRQSMVNNGFCVDSSEVRLMGKCPKCLHAE